MRPAGEGPEGERHVHLLRHEDEKDTRAEREGEVVALEGELALERRLGP